MAVDDASRQEIEWERPVTIRFSYGAAEEISGPREALEYLDNGWPGDEGLLYSIARRACQEALGCRSAPALARQAFISAAIEADILA